LQEKYGSLLVLQRKKGSAGMKNTRDAFKTIGIASLAFHEAVTSPGGTHEQSLPLQVCLSSKAIVIIAMVANERDGNASDAGSFMTDDDNESISAGSLVGRSRTGNPTSLPGMPSGSTLNSSMYSGTPNSLLNTNGNNGILGGNTDFNSIRPVSIATANKPSNSLYNSGNNSASNNLNTNVNNSKPFATTSSISPTSTNVKELQQRILELENIMLESADIVESEKQKAQAAILRAGQLETELSAYRGYSNNNPGHGGNLIQELTDLKEENQMLHDSNNNLRDMNQKYTIDINKIRASYLETQEEMQKLLQEKNKLEKLLKEKNDECENLLSELIKAKMSVGDLSTELDEVKRELKHMKQGAVNGTNPRPINNNGNNTNPNRKPPQQPGGQGGGARTRTRSSEDNNNNSNYNAPPQPPSNRQPQQLQGSGSGGGQGSGRNNTNQQSYDANLNYNSSNNNLIDAQNRNNGNYYGNNYSDGNNNRSQFATNNVNSSTPGNMRTNNNNNSLGGASNNFSSNYNNSSSNGSSSSGTTMLRGFGSSNANNNNSASRSNPLNDGISSLRRGFDSVSGNLFGNDNSGNNNVANSNSNGQRKPPPMRPVF
jgi:hypothetical protein